MSDTLNEMQALIARTVDDIKELLLSKNRKYGNAALDPMCVFSKLSASDRLRVRIDDKLSRIRTMGLVAEDEDTLQDLIGYLVLLRIENGRTASCKGSTPASTAYVGDNQRESATHVVDVKSSTNATASGIQFYTYNKKGVK